MLTLRKTISWTSHKADFSVTANPQMGTKSKQELCRFECLLVGWSQKKPIKILQEAEAPFM